MIAASFVDEFIPDWQMPDDGHHSVTAEVEIVYAPEMSCALFDRSCKELDKRRDAYIKRLRTNRKPNQRLHLIDATSIAAAREACGTSTGRDYLDQFMFDTEKSATFALGEVIQRAKRSQLSVTPQHARQAVSVIPGRSFTSTDALSAHQQGRRTKWRPTVRLNIRINFEGKREAVEAAIADFKAAMLFCGPVTGFRETAVSPQRRQANAAIPTLVAV